MTSPLSPRKWTKDDDDLVLQLRREGQTVMQICKKMGITKDSLSNRVRRLRDKGLAGPSAATSPQSFMPSSPMKKSRPLTASPYHGDSLTTSSPAKRAKLYNSKSPVVSAPPTAVKEYETVTGHDVRKLVEGWLQGSSILEICSAVGCSAVCVQKSIAELKRDGILTSPMRISPQKSSSPSKPLLWADEDTAALLNFIQQGYATEDLVKHTGRTRSSIENRLRILKEKGAILCSPRKPVWTQDQDHQLIRLRAERKQFHEIARLMNRPNTSVPACIKRFSMLKEQGKVPPEALVVPNRLQKSERKSAVIHGA
ncbi:hypothetical protein P154DRAFT_47049 [Amniculicola lignicola CBS 123094]|uniref:HTH marR-type domain-containing protein n=1 Tax=Amniculicola lignicola CBS 123094 TaxID=1392246 RepID=A0A6A5VX77_9PLEO|nr:hypothetical protein P154DRAFT_47049 [Amniculicola lignicola CBS 123094]